MFRNLLLAAGVLLSFCKARGNAAELLQDTLRAANVPTGKFAASELRREITSYAISTGNPFLLAYYMDHRSGLLAPPLHVIRYVRETDDLRRAGLQDIHALFQESIPMDCLGSALRIREDHGTIYIETHINPSAGCVIVLDSGLSFRAALSGWLLGLLGADYAILRESEVHVMPVHPLHIEVFDLKRNRPVRLYPPENDGFRRQFSRLIAAGISGKWCRENNAQCDPENFDTDLAGGLAVNEDARVFGFEARFDAAGFGDAIEKQAPPRTVAYIFRERGGKWEYRAFGIDQIRSRFGVPSIRELVARNPYAAFDLFRE